MSPGSSQWFGEGFVTYSNEAKARALGVSRSVLERHGAVSEAAAIAMAEGALGRSRRGLSVAVTGIAGPDGAVPGKPVGTVWFGWAERRGGRVRVTAERRNFRGDREAVRRKTVRGGAARAASPLGAGMRLFFATFPEPRDAPQDCGGGARDRSRGSAKVSAARELPRDARCSWARFPTLRFQSIREIGEAQRIERFSLRFDRWEYWEEARAVVASSPDRPPSTDGVAGGACRRTGATRRRLSMTSRCVRI